MAIYGQDTEKKNTPPSTDESVMFEDAKRYAKTEFTSIVTLMQNMKIEVAEEELAKQWIQVKFDQIKAKREARKTYFD